MGFSIPATHNPNLYNHTYVWYIMGMIVDVQKSDRAFGLKLPFYLSPVPAGFPSPADDYLDRKLDLNDHLIKHPAATFFVKVKGDSMIKAGIHSGDILVVDRSLEPRDKKVVVAVVNGEFTVKRVRKLKDKLFLISENDDYMPVEIKESADFEVWGVVLHVIHSV